MICASPRFKKILETYKTFGELVSLAGEAQTRTEKIKELHRSLDEQQAFRTFTTLTNDRDIFLLKQKKLLKNNKKYRLFDIKDEKLIDTIKKLQEYDNKWTIKNTDCELKSGTYSLNLFEESVASKHASFLYESLNKLDKLKKGFIYDKNIFNSVASAFVINSFNNLRLQKLQDFLAIRYSGNVANLNSIVDQSLCREYSRNTQPQANNLKNIDKLIKGDLCALRPSHVYITIDRDNAFLDNIQGTKDALLQQAKHSRLYDDCFEHADLFSLFKSEGVWTLKPDLCKVLDVKTLDEEKRYNILRYLYAIYLVPWHTQLRNITTAFSSCIDAFDNYKIETTRGNPYRRTFLAQHDDNHPKRAGIFCNEYGFFGVKVFDDDNESKAKFLTSDIFNPADVVRSMELLNFGGCKVERIAFETETGICTSGANNNARLYSLIQKSIVNEYLKSKNNKINSK